MKGFYKKYKVLIYVVLFLLLMILAFIVLKRYLFPDDYKSVYGSRLNGIENVKFDSNRLMAVKNGISTDKFIDNVTINVRGRKINVIIKGKKEYTMEHAKKTLLDNLKVFQTNELNFYDIEFFVTNEELKYNMIGYKNKKSEVIVWSEHKEEVLDEK
mgnify:CR=1 FL=1